MNITDICQLIETQKKFGNIMHDIYEIKNPYEDFAKSTAINS